MTCQNKDKIIDAFKNGTFFSEHLRTSDDAAYNHVLEDVNNFIQKIESMAEKINLDLFKEFFELASPADCAKEFINVQDPNENKKNCSQYKRQNIRFKRQNKRNGRKRKKIKVLMRHYRLLKKFLITITRLKKFFHLHQKLIKENQKQDKNLINQFLKGCKCQKIDLIL